MVGGAGLARVKSFVPSGARQGLQRWQFFTKALCSIGILALLLAGLSDQLSTLKPADVAEALSRISWGTVLAAIGCTAISFWAIAGYDRTAMRLLALPVPPGRALVSGFVATGISQTTGFGLVVGSVVRWRMYRGVGLGPVETAQCTLVVSLAFMMSLFVAIPGMVLINPDAVTRGLGLGQGVVIGLSVCCLAIGALVAALCAVRPELVLWGRSFQPPPLRGAARFLVLALADTVPAAGALWLLLPPDAGIGFLEFLPVFLLAMGLGLVTNAPGGIGVLETLCFLAFAHIPPAELLAALLAFRAIYYGLPLILAAGTLAAEEARTGHLTDERRRHPRHPDIFQAAGPNDLPRVARAALAQSSIAQSALATLGDKTVLLSPDRRGFVMYAEAGNALIGLSEPVGPSDCHVDCARRFVDEARARLLVPALYKIGPAFAQMLSTEGWRLTQVGSEAMIAPQGFGLDGAQRRELRRKLAQAGRAGVTIRHHPPARAPLGPLRQISDGWLTDKGLTERGFSMGRFDPDYLSQFDILAAEHEGRPVAFVSLWRSGDGTEWSVDLMRHRADVPSGTMQMLIADAIRISAEAGARRFSLCAVPFSGLPVEGSGLERIGAAVYARRGAGLGLHGLHRFKNGFRPDWEPRYLATTGILPPVSTILALRRLIG